MLIPLGVPEGVVRIQLKWPKSLAPIKKHKMIPDFEEHVLKAHLESSTDINGYTLKLYNEMFGVEAPKNVRFYILRKALYGGGLELGYKRTGFPFKGVDKSFSDAVRSLNEKALSEGSVWKYICGKKMEKAEFRGLEIHCQEVPKGMPKAL